MRRRRSPDNSSAAQYGAHVRAIRRGLAAVALTGLAVGLLAAPAVGSAAPRPAETPRAHAASSTAKALPSCIVGTWRDGHEAESTDWADHKVTMHYSGGDVDHFSAKGVDKDSWKHAHAEHGTYQGSTLTEVIRGELTEHLHADGKGKLRITSGSWSSSSTNSYTYQGRHYPGYLNPVTAFTLRYSCTAKKLTYYNKKGHVTGKETRISRKP